MLSLGVFSLPSPISQISGESNCISVGLAARGGGWVGVGVVLLGCGQTPGCTYSLRGGGMEGSVDAVWTDVLQVAPPPDGSR